MLLAKISHRNIGILMNIEIENATQIEIENVRKKTMAMSYWIMEDAKEWERDSEKKRDSNEFAMTQWKDMCMC